MSHGGKDAVCDKNGNLVPIQDIIDGMSPPHIDGIPKVERMTTKESTMFYSCL